MKIVECPRDAMQGLPDFVPTDLKVTYIDQLLRVGFDTLDFGSFVSPKAIPQMRDTAEVLSRITLGASKTRLLAIVANIRGAEQALEFEEIDFLGYPLSLSETFQQRNTNRTISSAFDDLAEIRELCEADDKGLVVYLSMGFGNPYGDPYSAEIVSQYVDRLDQLEVDVISLSDTVGVASTDQISDLFTSIIPTFPHIEFGAHLHATPDVAASRVRAAVMAGCQRIDGALLGYGGCPMANDELVGNIATETILSTLNELQRTPDIDLEALNLAHLTAKLIFKTRAI